MVGHWTHRKRRAQVEPVDERDDVVDELAELRIFRDQLTQPLTPSVRHAVRLLASTCATSRRRGVSRVNCGRGSTYQDCIAALREA